MIKFYDVDKMEDVEMECSKIDYITNASDGQIVIVDTQDNKYYTLMVFFE